MDHLTEKQARINIALFGPPDHGKSTLIGYLSSAYAAAAFKKYIHKLKKELGSFFQEDRKYAYVSDKHITEQIGESSVENRRAGAGTTQHAHVIEVDISAKKYYFIDNPGHYKWAKETSKGLSRGDYGIFVLAITEFWKNRKKFETLLKQDTIVRIPDEFREYILPLYIALKLGIKLGPIVFSKMDLIDYDQEIYRESEKLIISFLQKFFNLKKDDVVVVPISILVFDERAENVLQSSSVMPWYNGGTFISCIESLSPPTNSELSSLFFPVQKSYFKVPGHRLIFTGKVVRGKIAKNDNIRIAPLDRASCSSIEAKVRSIHYDVTERDEPPSIEEALPGNLVGVSINLDDKNIELIKDKIGSCPFIVTHKETPISCGNVLCVQIQEGDFPDEEPSFFEFRKEFQLLLNGKYLNSHFLGYLAHDNAVHCFKINTVIAGIRDEDNNIIGINPLIISQGPIYYQDKDSKKMKSMERFIRIASVKLPIIGLGSLKKLRLSIPSAIYEALADRFGTIAVKRFDNDVEMFFDGNSYDSFEIALVSLRKRLTGC